jgi:integrase
LICSKCKATIDNSFVYCPHCGKKQAQTTAPKPRKRANGEGSVYKVGGRRAKPWVVTRNKVVIGTTATRAEGYELLEKTKNIDVTTYDITLGHVFELWKESHYKTLNDDTITTYDVAWLRLSALENKKMREIKTQHIQKIVDDAISKKGTPLSVSGKKKILILARQLFDYAVQNDVISKNYAEFVKLENNTKKEKNIFTKEDIQKFVADNSYTSQIMLVLIYTGFRINELFDVTIKDVNLELGYIVGGEKTEAGINRVVPIHPAIRHIVESWCLCGGDYLVKNSESGKKNARNFRTRDLYPLLDALNIERKTPHDARRTFATMAAASGMRPEVMQKIIGHADYSTTTDFYIKTQIQDLAEAINKIDFC